MVMIATDEDEKTIAGCLTPIAIVCEEDPQEKKFDALVQLWVDGKISYDILMENYPDYDEPMYRKIIGHLLKMFD